MPGSAAGAADGGHHHAPLDPCSPREMARDIRRAGAPARGDAGRGDDRHAVPGALRLLGERGGGRARSPGTPPPGSNDWSCRPSAAHPDPVVLVHGLFANMTDNWQTMSPLLANNGYCVFAFTYGTHAERDSRRSNSAGSRRWSRARRSCRRSSTRSSPPPARTKVDIVGHSEGATMPDYYIEYLGGAAKVASLRRRLRREARHHAARRSARSPTTFGTLFPAAPTPTAGVVRLVRGVPRRLRLRQADRSARAGAGRHLHQHRHPVRRAREPVHEQLPQRAERHQHPRAGPLRARLRDHLSIISSPITGRYILNALDPAHAQPVPCVPVAPAA